MKAVAVAVSTDLMCMRARLIDPRIDKCLGRECIRSQRHNIALSQPAPRKIRPHVQARFYARASQERPKTQLRRSSEIQTRALVCPRVTGVSFLSVARCHQSLPVFLATSRPYLVSMSNHSGDAQPLGQLSPRERLYAEFYPRIKQGGPKAQLRRSSVIRIRVLVRPRITEVSCLGISTRRRSCPHSQSFAVFLVESGPYLVKMSIHARKTHPVDHRMGQLCPQLLLLGMLHVDSLHVDSLHMDSLHMDSLQMDSLLDG